MNPLDAIPPKARLYAYALLSVAALALAAWQASQGDWLEFAGLLLGSLGFGTATRHTPATFGRDEAGRLRVLAAAAIASLTLAAAAVVAVVGAPPGNASPYCTYGGNCGGILHWWDAGYDAPFIVACDRNNKWGSSVHVYEGTWDSCADADAIYVRSGEQIVCTNNWGQWQIKYDATGWHNIYDNERPHCVAQLD